MIICINFVNLRYLLSPYFEKTPIVVTFGQFPYIPRISAAIFSHKIGLELE